MHFIRAAVATFLALAFSLTLSKPAQAAPPSQQIFATGLHAHQVEPLMLGVVAQGIQVAVFAGCFLALDDGDTCTDIATRARDSVEPSKDRSARDSE